MSADFSSRVFLSPFRVRSSELDSFGHVNHAVYLSYLEQARFESLELGGFPLAELVRRNWAVHVVRVEVDYRRECRLGDRLVVRTEVGRFRNSSMILQQKLFRFRAAPDGLPPDPAEANEGTEALLEHGEEAVSARIVAVWVGPDGKPMRIPDEVRDSLIRS